MSARHVFIIGFLALIAVATAVAVVYARQESRRLFVQLAALENERDELNIDFGRLQLEQATWAETHRIETIARGELGMTFPGPLELRVIRP